MRSTQCGVNMDLPQLVGSGKRIAANLPIVDYVRSKYDGLPEKLQRVILFPFFQHAMKHGTNRRALS